MPITTWRIKVGAVPPKGIHKSRFNFVSTMGLIAIRNPFPHVASLPIFSNLFCFFQHRVKLL